MAERVTEPQLREAALHLLAEAPEGFLATSSLIASLEHRFAPDGEDSEVLANRSDTRFSQKVRNRVSHRNAPRSLEGMGYAEYDRKRRGWRITELGKSFIGTKKP